MGLADLFSKDARNRRNLEKTIQRANDKHGQSADRWKSLETLRDDGRPEAILGMLRRFSFNYDKTIEDEQEKEWVYQELCGLGGKILPPLREYMRDSETLSWSLKILENITKGDTFRDTLRQLCEWNDNSYVRDPSKKIQLVHFLGEHRDPALTALVVPYLEDVDEGVRFKAVEALFHHGQPELALAPLIKLLRNPSEESRRIKVAILEGLSKAKWPLGEHTASVKQQVDELGLDGRVDKESRLALVLHDR